MIDISEFLRTEINTQTRGIFYQSIIEWYVGERVLDKICLNRFSVNLNFKEDSVTIFDDVYPEDEQLIVSVKEFFYILKNAVV